MERFWTLAESCLVAALRPPERSEDAVMSIRNSYKVLEVDYGASLAEVKQGYKDLVRVWHPDRFPEDPRLRKKAEEKLKEINRAYGDLVAYLSNETDELPRPGSCFLPRSWGRYWLVIGGAAAGLGRTLYEEVCSALRRIGQGTCFPRLFDSEKESASVPNDRGFRTKNSPDARGGPRGIDRRKGMDFRSVLDEVAKEKDKASRR